MALNEGMTTRKARLLLAKKSFQATIVEPEAINPKYVYELPFKITMGNIHSSFTWLPSPSTNSMKKKNTAHNGDRGICAMPSG